MALQQNGQSDQQDEAVLDKVELELFTADPHQIAPFGVSTISWKVKIPDFDIAVSIRLNGAPVDRNGELQISPQTTVTYRLDAHAGSRARQLGQLTVSVNLSACVTKSAGRCRGYSPG